MVSSLGLGVARHLADRHRQEGALRGQVERWQVTLSSIGDAVIVTDCRGPGGLHESRRGRSAAGRRPRQPAGRWTRSSASSMNRPVVPSRTRLSGCSPRARSWVWPTTRCSSPPTPERSRSTTAPPRSYRRRAARRRGPHLPRRDGAAAGPGAEPVAGGDRRVVRRHHRVQDAGRRDHELEQGGRAHPRLYRRGGHRPARLHAHAPRTGRGHAADPRADPPRREGGPLPDQAQRKDGTIIDVSLTVSPIRDAAGRIIGASKIGRDITQQKLIEAERRRPTAARTSSWPCSPTSCATRWRPSERPSSTSDAGADDELRLGQGGHRPPGQALGPPAGRPAGRLPHHPRQDRLRKELIDASRSSTRPSRRSGRSIDERSTAEVSIAPGRLRLEADPVRLEQILVNLLTNAAKYTDGRGPHLAHGRARRGPRSSSGSRDNGVGIRPRCCRRSSTCSPRGTARWPARRGAWASG